VSIEAVWALQLDAVSSLRLMVLVASKGQAKAEHGLMAHSLTVADGGHLQALDGTWAHKMPLTGRVSAALSSG
jgi:hypothetical protein